MLRKAYGFPMHIWASLLGCTQPTVSRWESPGDKQSPLSGRHTQRMARLLRVYQSPELVGALRQASDEAGGDGLVLTWVVLRHVYGDKGIRLPSPLSSPMLDP